MNLKDPKVIILIGLLITSIGFNFLFLSSNQRLIEQLKKKPKVIIVPIYIEKEPQYFTNI